MVQTREPPKDDEEGRLQDPEQPQDPNHPAEFFLGFDQGPAQNPNFFFHDMENGFRAPPPEDSDSEEESEQDSDENSQEDEMPDLEEEHLHEIIQEPVENGKILFVSYVNLFIILQPLSVQKIFCYLFQSWKIFPFYFKLTEIYLQNRKRSSSFDKIGLFNFMVIIWKIFSTRRNISEITRTIFQST